MIKPKVSVNAKGPDRILAIEKALRDTAHLAVTVGVHSDAGVYESGADIAVVAAAQEFGTEHIPSRSYLRSTVDDNLEVLNKWRQDAIGRIVDGKVEPEAALESIGFRLAAKVQTRIMSDVKPPLTEKYKRWKIRQGKPPRTLILTGLLHSSIAYRVEGSR